MLILVPAAIWPRRTAWISCRNPNTVAGFEPRAGAGDGHVGAHSIQRVQHGGLRVLHPGGRRRHSDHQADTQRQAQRDDDRLAHPPPQFPSQVGKEHSGRFLSLGVSTAARTGIRRWIRGRWPATGGRRPRPWPPPVSPTGASPKAACCSCAPPPATRRSPTSAARLGITRQGASKIVAALRERGYVVVTPSAGDGREKILTLTSRAAEFLLTIHRASGDIEARLREKIGAEGVEQFFRVLDMLAWRRGRAPRRSPRNDTGPPGAAVGRNRRGSVIPDVPGGQRPSSVCRSPDQVPLTWACHMLA